MEVTELVRGTALDMRRERCRRLRCNRPQRRDARRRRRRRRRRRLVPWILRTPTTARDEGQRTSKRQTTHATLSTRTVTPSDPNPTGRAGVGTSAGRSSSTVLTTRPNSSTRLELGPRCLDSAVPISLAGAAPGTPVTPQAERLPVGGRRRAHGARGLPPRCQRPAPAARRPTSTSGSSSLPSGGINRESSSRASRPVARQAVLP